MDNETFYKWTAENYWLKYKSEITEMATFEYWVTPQGRTIKVTIKENKIVTIISI